MEKNDFMEAVKGMDPGSVYVPLRYLDNLFEEVTKAPGGSGAFKVDGVSYTTDTAYASAGMCIFLDILHRRLLGEPFGGDLQIGG